MRNAPSCRSENALAEKHIRCYTQVAPNKPRSPKPFSIDNTQFLVAFLSLETSTGVLYHIAAFASLHYRVGILNPWHPPAQERHDKFPAHCIVLFETLDRSPTFQPTKMLVPKTWLGSTPSILEPRDDSNLISYAANSGNSLKTSTANRKRRIAKKGTRKWDDATGSEQGKSVSAREQSVDAQAVVEKEMTTERDAHEDHEHSRTWRPDQDEMCSTTTTVRRGSDGMVVVGHLMSSSITITRSFEWHEARR